MFVQCIFSVSDFCDVDRFFVLYMFICLCIVIYFMWTPGRIVTTAVEANGDLT